MVMELNYQTYLAMSNNKANKHDISELGNAFVKNIFTFQHTHFFKIKYKHLNIQS